MKITGVETLICNAGWRPWEFVKIQTDEGITGYGECSDSYNPYGIAGCVHDLLPVLLGRDPRAVEVLNAEMVRVMRQSPGGVGQKALAGIDAALWDIKAKALGVPVYELFGGPTREKIRLYWSHCGTTRARAATLIGAPPLRTLADVARLGEEVVRRGFTALKTNIFVPGDPPTMHRPGFAGAYPGVADLNADRAVVRQAENLVGTFREAVGPNVDIALDLNFNFKTEGYIRLARAMEPYDLMWLELDTYDPAALLQIKQSTKTPITSGESLYTPRGYKPFLDLHAMDVVVIDVPWNGFTVSKKIADLVELYELNFAPHNYYSHLSTLMSAHLCAVAGNVRILEIDIDDVPWKDDLITEPLEIEEGHLVLPKRPGWGADLNEKEVAKHPWPR
ncbi:MAG: mandelate racemase/muconate lactonizing enzyme family protein [Dehalococcoidales bacterium]|nr:mandelate racemase/muconate lactonizing enzyme family protein [Dehalococcoidales bacterium]